MGHIFMVNSCLPGCNVNIMMHSWRYDRSKMKPPGGPVIQTHDLSRSNTFSTASCSRLIKFSLCGPCAWQTVWHATRKSAGVTKNISSGSVLFRCPSKPWQCYSDGESACTTPGSWHWSSHMEFSLFIFKFFFFFIISSCAFPAVICEMSSST